MTRVGVEPATCGLEVGLFCQLSGPPDSQGSDNLQSRARRPFATIPDLARVIADVRDRARLRAAPASGGAAAPTGAVEAIRVCAHPSP